MVVAGTKLLYNGLNLGMEIDRDGLVAKQRKTSKLNVQNRLVFHIDVT